MVLVVRRTVASAEIARRNLIGVRKVRWIIDQRPGRVVTLDCGMMQD